MNRVYTLILVDYADQDHIHVVGSAMDPSLLVNQETIMPFLEEKFPHNDDYAHIRDIEATKKIRKEWVSEMRKVLLDIDFSTTMEPQILGSDDFYIFYMVPSMVLS